MKINLKLMRKAIWQCRMFDWPGRKYSQAGAVLGMVVLLFVSRNAAVGATIPAASAAFPDVQRAVNQASAGDTVTVPSGTYTWTSQLVITYGITLQGAGTNVTVITSTLNPALLINNRGNAEARVTGFTFDGGGAQTFGPVQLTGNLIRLDSCSFTNCGLFSLYSSDAFGVIDHCIFQEKDAGIYVQNPSYGGQSNGDGSWTDGDNFGTTNFMYIEDCAFYGVGQMGAMDGCAGARWVFRHNYVTNDVLVAHGTDSTQRARGTRAIEIYNNTFAGRTQFWRRA